MGDAPPHDPEPFTGFTAATVIAAAEAVDPAKIFAITVGFDPFAHASFEALAEGTNGEILQAPTASDVVAAIVGAIQVIPPPSNTPPNCTFALAEPSRLWPPNHELTDVSIVGVEDPEGDPVSLTISGITQDEPVTGFGSGTLTPDGFGIGLSLARLRAERSGRGNGRVYEISFVASDDKGAECAGSVLVGVPHDRGANAELVDDGQVFDSSSEMTARILSSRPCGLLGWELLIPLILARAISRWRRK